MKRDKQYSYLNQLSDETYEWIINRINLGKPNMYTSIMAQIDSNFKKNINNCYLVIKNILTNEKRIKKNDITIEDLKYYFELYELCFKKTYNKKKL